MNTLLNTKSGRSVTPYDDFGMHNFPTSNRPALVSLKTKLVQKLSAEFSDVESHLVRQAVNEADSLASQTIVPQLVLPTLAEEKVQALRKWTARQRAVLYSASFAMTA